MNEEESPDRSGESRAGNGSGGNGAERERLEDLRSLDVLDSGPEPEFDALVETASLIAGTPTAVVTLIDEDRVWFKAKKGMEREEAPREVSFCARVLDDPGAPLVIEDTREDPEWSGNPMVTGPPHIAFYAGFPILSYRGNVVGSLCVMDQEPHVLTEDQVKALEGQATQAASMLELRQRTLAVRDRLATGVEEEGRDRLTGLLDRPALEEAIRETGEQGGSGQASVVVFKLTRFSEVNALLGHEGGDAVIREAVLRLASEVPSRDLMSRLGGTAFAALLPGADQHRARRLASQLIDAFEKPVRAGDLPPVRLSVAVGVSTSAPAGEISRRNLLSSAELAAADAKRSGPDSLVEASVGGRLSDAKAARVKTALVEAIEEGGLAVAYMPIVRLVDGVQVGSEALLRWPQGSNHGMSVEEMVAMAETEGLIDRLDQFVLATALSDFAAGRIGGEEVSVNLTPSGVTRELIEQVTAELERTGVAPECLMLEVTERVVMGDRPGLVEVLEELHGMGVRIAIDDFGSGVTSISDLQTIPFDRLKIDRALTMNVGQQGEERAEKVVAAVVSLAGAMEAETVAEGVEEEFQRERLVELGVENGQGYLFGRAAPVGFRPAGEEPETPEPTAAPTDLDRLASDFFEQTSDLACITTRDGQLLKVNSNFTRILGWTPQELMKGRLLDFVHPDDVDRTVETLAYVRPDRPLKDFENRHLTTEGQWRRIVWNTSIDADSGLILAIGRDVTEEREAEERSDELAEILEALVGIERQYIDEGPTPTWWMTTLDRLLDLTDSPYGFIGWVDEDEEGILMRVQAFSDIAWNEWSRGVYEEFREGGLEFRNMDTLFGRSIMTGESVITGDARNDPRGGGFPEGHPQLTSYAGVPLRDPEGIVGMVGLANREGGYTEELLEQMAVIFEALAGLVSRMLAAGRLESFESDTAAFAGAISSILECDGFREALGVAISELAGQFPGAEVEFFGVSGGEEGHFERYELDGGDGAGVLSRGDCMALERGEPHLSDRRRGAEERCSHAEEGRTVLCLPVETGAEEYGVLVVTEAMPGGGSESDPGQLAGAIPRLSNLVTALSEVAHRDSIAHRSLTDSLTGLPNRDAMVRAFNRGLAAVAAGRGPIGFLMLDLDHFKPVNDDLGHEAGDRLLGAVGTALRGAVREGDEVARLGGDEFGILIPGADQELLRDTGERIRQLIAALPVEGGHRVTASIGGVEVTGPATTWDEAFRIADEEMYRQKEAGRDRLGVVSKALGRD